MADRRRRDGLIVQCTCARSYTYRRDRDERFKVCVCVCAVTTNMFNQFACKITNTQFALDNIICNTHSRLESLIEQVRSFQYRNGAQEKHPL